LSSLLFAGSPKNTLHLGWRYRLDCLSMQNTASIKLINVSKTYWLGAVGVKALCDIQLEIPAMKFTSIIGPSGSGKTTLLNLMGCLDAPTSGEIEVIGKNMKDRSDNFITDFRSKNIGFIFQNFSLLPVLTALENVEFPLLLEKVSKSEIRTRALEMLEAVGLLEQKNQRPNELSGGQRQRVAIARALVKNPKIVFADEPTANLDSNTGTNIIALMKEMQQKFHTTFIFSSHDQKIMDCSDQIFHIRDGVLQRESS